jgi:hypothetical protein
MNETIRYTIRKFIFWQDGKHSLFLRLVKQVISSLCLRFLPSMVC